MRRLIRLAHSGLLQVSLPRGFQARPGRFPCGGEAASGGLAPCRGFCVAFFASRPDCGSSMPNAPRPGFRIASGLGGAVSPHLSLDCWAFQFGLWVPSKKFHLRLGIRARAAWQNQNNSPSQHVKVLFGARYLPASSQPFVGEQTRCDVSDAPEHPRRPRGFFFFED